MISNYYSSVYLFLTVNGGTQPPKAFSNSTATARQCLSRFLDATTCIPNGIPFESKPSGT